MKLKELRQNHNLTQQMVAEYLNCSAVNYSRYETGERQPSIEILAQLADLYHVSIDYLVGRNSQSAAKNISPEDGDPPLINEKSQSLNLTLREATLIEAFRNADPRARNDSLNLLLIHDARAIPQE